eukprot:s1817_g6.t1
MPRRAKRCHVLCMSAVAAGLVAKSRLFGASFAGAARGISSRNALRPGGRIDVLSRHLDMAPAGLKGSRAQMASRHGKSRAAIVAAATAAGMAAGGVLVADGPKDAELTEKELSFAQIAKLPRPGFQTIGASSFLPDGSHVLYLKSSEYGSLSRQLYATDVSTGKTVALACTPPGTGEEKELSLEEKLRRERARQMNTGVTSFKVAGSGQGLVLVPMGGANGWVIGGGALYVREGIEEKAELKRLFDPSELGSGPLIDPQISDDGSLAAR